MTSHDRPLQGELLDWRRTISAEASTAWLLAEGLVSSLLQLGWTPGGGDVRAPGLLDLVSELAFLAAASTDALEKAVDGAWAAQDEHGSDLAGLLAEAEALLGGPLDVAKEARLAIVAGVTVRRAGQAALGATSCLPGSAELIRLERACVELLAFGSNGSHTVPLHRDGLRLYSLDSADLICELAGIGARLLCDWGGAVIFGTADGRSLELRARGDRLVASPSWADGEERSWDSPVRLAVVARELNDVLNQELGATCARDLSVIVSP